MTLSPTLYQSLDHSLGSATCRGSAIPAAAQLLCYWNAPPNACLPGSRLLAGMAVFDTMRHIRPDVSTVCIGLAASMGAFLLASGQQVCGSAWEWGLRLSMLCVHTLSGSRVALACMALHAFVNRVCYCVKVL
jgi:hypothetical protein